MLFILHSDLNHHLFTKSDIDGYIFPWFLYVRVYNILLCVSDRVNIRSSSSSFIFFWWRWWRSCDAGVGARPAQELETLMNRGGKLCAEGSSVNWIAKLNVWTRPQPNIILNPSQLVLFFGLFFTRLIMTISAYA